MGLVRKCVLYYYMYLRSFAASIKDWLCNKYSMKFGLFLACFVSWFKVKQVSLYYLVPRKLGITSVSTNVQY